MMDAGIAERTDERINGDHLFESLVCDLHWTFLQAGIVTHLVNACLTAHGTWTLRTWRHLLHDNGAIIQLGLRYCPEMRIAPSLGRTLSAAYTSLSEAKAATAPLMQVGGRYGTSELAVLRSVALRWRSVCQGGVASLQAVGADVRTRLPELYAEDAQTLQRFLREAVAGEGHRVDAFGAMAAPALRQRRRTPRLEVSQPCRLIVDDVRVASTLLDVSRQGAAVSCRRRLAANHPVTLELADGRRLQAHVMRQDGDRTGLQFAVALPGDDTLFRV